MFSRFFPAAQLAIYSPPCTDMSVMKGSNCGLFKELNSKSIYVNGQVKGQRSLTETEIEQPINMISLQLKKRPSN